MLLSPCMSECRSAWYLDWGSSRWRGRPPVGLLHLSGSCPATPAGSSSGFYLPSTAAAGTRPPSQIAAGWTGWANLGWGWDVRGIPVPGSGWGRARLAGGRGCVWSSGGAAGVTQRWFEAIITQRSPDSLLEWSLPRWKAPQRRKQKKEQLRAFWRFFWTIEDTLLGRVGSLRLSILNPRLRAFVVKRTHAWPCAERWTPHVISALDGERDKGLW